MPKARQDRTVNRRKGFLVKYRWAAGLALPVLPWALLTLLKMLGLQALTGLQQGYSLSPGSSGVSPGPRFLQRLCLCHSDHVQDPWGHRPWNADSPEWQLFPGSTCFPCSFRGCHSLASLPVSLGLEPSPSAYGQLSSCYLKAQPGNGALQARVLVAGGSGPNGLENGRLCSPPQHSKLGLLESTACVTKPRRDSS